MKVSRFSTTGVTLAIGAMLAFSCATSSRGQDSSPTQPPQAGAGQGSGQGIGLGGGRMRGGMGEFGGGGRGLMGTVTEVAADHYTVKTDAGESYTVFFSANTRIMKQPPSRRAPGDAAGQGSGQGGGQAGGQGTGQGRARGEGDRPMPQVLKPTDIKVGDAIMAGGDLDAAKKTVGAMMIMQMDPERAKQARALEAQFGKTWLAGRITAIDGTKITIEGSLDHVPHAFEVDENTSFHKRRDSITMADIKVGDQLRLEGAVKEGVFLATVVNAMEFQPRDQGATGPR